MRWLLEAAAQNVLSYVPRGADVQYVIQRRVLRTLPGGDEGFRQKATRALQHFRAFREHGPERDFAAARLYEFGAGWDLAVPLTLHALGAGSQTLVDLRRLLHTELVEDSLRKIEAHRDWLEREAEAEVKPVDRRPVRHVGDLRERFAIEYLAPADARATGLPAASFDVVSSTDTLEHIPTADIARILAECRRLLRPDGIMSCRIDLEDHYAPSDRSISRYNFLRYSDRTWRLLSPPLHYLNRLRYPDYVRLFREAGFEVAAERASRPTAQDLETLRRLELAPRFRDGYTLEELGVRGLVVVARPADA